MATAIITGSAGLIGSEAVVFFAQHFDRILGIDNDMRQHFFGEEGSTKWNRDRLLNDVANYSHFDIDIRDKEAIERMFADRGKDIRLVIHSAAQPSHDWAARDPQLDFTVNAVGTQILLEAARKHCPDAVFIFTSTNKVYGDNPNRLPLVETPTRWELAENHPYHANGIDEGMSIDQCKHTPFGASKVAADVMVQEYGRYFGLKTGVFRGGCLTGPRHSGTQLHGFLQYLMKCTATGTPYTVFGHQGKQVRDNIHSRDLVQMFWHFYRDPRVGEVYNAGGSRHSNCSMLEAIDACERIAGKKLSWTYRDESRIGDHIWYISDVSKFRDHFPKWEYQFGLSDILIQIHAGLSRKQ